MRDRCACPTPLVPWQLTVERFILCAWRTTGHRVASDFENTKPSPDQATRREFSPGVQRCNKVIMMLRGMHGALGLDCR
jgi:hypothetical protein